jgi:hypothetical protein
MVVNVSVDVSDALSGIRQAENKIKNGSNRAVYSLANDGADIAASAAPKGSGRLISHIRSERTGKMSARIVSRNPAVYNHDGFSLPQWLHANSSLGTAGYAGKRAGYLGSVGSPQNHVNSGTAMYMELARDLIERQAKQEFNKQLNIS